MNREKHDCLNVWNDYRFDAISLTLASSFSVAALYKDQIFDMISYI